jgi:amino acid transporter
MKNLLFFLLCLSANTVQAFNYVAQDTLPTPQIGIVQSPTDTLPKLNVRASESACMALVAVVTYIFCAYITVIPAIIFTLLAAILAILALIKFKKEPKKWKGKTWAWLALLPITIALIALIVFISNNFPRTIID